MDSLNAYKYSDEPVNRMDNFTQLQTETFNEIIKSSDVPETDTNKSIPSVSKKNPQWNSSRHIRKYSTYNRPIDPYGLRTKE